MKSAVSLTLIVSLAVPAVLLAAQEEIRTEPGSLARSIEREVNRLAADSTPQGLEAVQQRGNPGNSDWSLVRQLAPRTEIVVTVRGSQPAKWIFVSADESELTVVAPNDPALRDVVISRAEIAEIRSAVVRRPARKGALIGLVIGAAVGIATVSQCSGSGGEGACALIVPIIGGFAGAGAGVGAGVGALEHLATPDVIYRAVATSSFDQLRISDLVKQGDTVYVTDAGGQRVKGRIEDLAATSLVLLTGQSARRDFSEMAVRKIDRGDSLTNGTLIGLGVGAGVGIVSATSVCHSPDQLCLAGVTIWIGLPAMVGGTILGAVVDALMHKTVYLAPGASRSVRLGLSPMQSRNRKGVLISVRF